MLYALAEVWHIPFLCCVNNWVNILSQWLFQWLQNRIKVLMNAPEDWRRKGRDCMRLLLNSFFLGSFTQPPIPTTLLLSLTWSREDALWGLYAALLEQSCCKQKAALEPSMALPGHRHALRELNCACVPTLSSCEPPWEILQAITKQLLLQQ